MMRESIREYTEAVPERYRWALSVGCYARGIHWEGVREVVGTAHTLLSITNSRPSVDLRIDSQ
jgi:hypothetical protein